MIARRLAELQVGLSLLTRIPVGRITPPIPPVADASWSFPICGALVGAVSWGTFAAFTVAGIPAAAGALAAIAVAAILTGALHDDGLADFVDGVGGGRDRTGKLEIMRDSRIGSYGALALILAVGLKLVGIGAAGSLATFVATAAGSRCCITLAMWALPPARPDGLGHAAGTPTPGRVAAGVALALVLAAPLGVAGALMLAAATFGAATVGWIAARRIGGQTGDVLGAVQSVAEVAGWLALAALAGEG